jgi:putative transposase
MMRKKRTWSVQEKLAILKEAESEGVTATIRKHQIYGNTLYEWRKKYERSGERGLETPYERVDPEVRRLEEENLKLKELVAEKELIIRIKDDLLKKTAARGRIGG